MNHLLQDLEAIKAKVQPNLHILGIVMNRIDLRRRLTKKLLAKCQQIFGKTLFTSFISNDTAIPNSIHRGLPLRGLNWQSKTVKQMNHLVNEILERLGMCDDEE